MMSALSTQYPLFFHHYRDGACPHHADAPYPSEQMLLVFFGSGQAEQSEDSLSAFEELNRFAKVQQSKRLEMLAPRCRALHHTTGLCRGMSLRNVCVSCVFRFTISHKQSVLSAAGWIGSGFVIPVYVDYSDSTVVQQMLGDTSSVNTAAVTAILLSLRSTGDEDQPPTQLDKKFRIQHVQRFHNGTLSKFVDDVANGNVPEFFRSQADPSKHLPSTLFSDQVTQVVGSTFQQSILSEETASPVVFLLWYAPWCGHCEKFANTFSRLAERVSAWEGVQLASFDVSVNDVANSDVAVPSGFPTLDLWVSSPTATRTVIRYNVTSDDSLRLPALIDFLAAHARGIQTRPGSEIAQRQFLQQRLAWLRVARDAESAHSFASAKVGSAAATDVTDALVIGVFNTGDDGDGDDDDDWHAKELFAAATDAVDSVPANLFVIESENAGAIAEAVMRGLPGSKGLGTETVASVSTNYECEPHGVV